MKIKYNEGKDQLPCSPTYGACTPCILGEGFDQNPLEIYSEREYALEDSRNTDPSTNLDEEAIEMEEFWDLPDSNEL